MATAILPARRSKAKPLRSTQTKPRATRRPNKCDCCGGRDEFFDCTRQLGEWWCLDCLLQALFEVSEISEATGCDWESAVGDWKSQ